MPGGAQPRVERGIHALIGEPAHGSAVDQVFVGQVVGGECLRREFAFEKPTGMCDGFCIHFKTRIAFFQSCAGPVLGLDPRIDPRILLRRAMLCVPARDCRDFRREDGAEPVIGPRFVRARWRLLPGNDVTN